MTQYNTSPNPQVPDVYVNLVAPAPAITPVQTNLIGVVGVASWGPINAPVALGEQNLASYFGGQVNRTYDMPTWVIAAAMSGGGSYYAVRVTDSTDTAATGVLGTTGVTLTSKYTGSLANTDVVAISAGSQASSWKITITRPGQQPEVFDNIAAGISGNAVWIAIAAAINSGNASRPSASQYIVAAAGASVSAPTVSSVTLTGGTDGAGVSATQLTGVDGNTRTGMYALRGIGPMHLIVCDAPTSMWATMAAFALTEGHYAIVAGPSGDFQTLAILSTFGALGVDTYALKALVGDYIYWLDTTNNITRLVSPAPFAAGKLAALNPWQYGLNKPIPNIVATQSSYANQKYSNATIAAISAGRMDVVTNGAPGGAYFALRTGRNSASNGSVNQDNYSRMAPYLQYSIGSSLGSFVGRLMTAQEQIDLYGALDGFLGGLAAQTAIGVVTLPGQQTVKPYTIQFAGTLAQLAAGLQTVNIGVTLLAGVIDLLLNLQAGTTVNQASGTVVTAAQ